MHPKNLFVFILFTAVQSYVCVCVCYLKLQLQHYLQHRLLKNYNFVQITTLNWEIWHKTFGFLSTVSSWTYRRKYNVRFIESRIVCVGLGFLGMSPYCRSSHNLVLLLLLLLQNRRAFKPRRKHILSTVVLILKQFT